jgi:hypothetical protein
VNERLQYVFRHAELVSASIMPPAAMMYLEGWTLKQVQGDEDAMGMRQ